MDYLLVLEPLKAAFKKSGVYRNGVYNLKKITAGYPEVEQETQLSWVTHWTNAASDHGAVWADFDLY